MRHRDLPRLPMTALVGAAIATATCSPGPVDAIALASDTLWNGLVAHYSFDELEGSVVSDSSGNGRNGEIHGGPAIVDGQFATAMQFDYGSFVTVPSFPDATRSWTVVAWVKLPAEQTPARRYVAVLGTELVFQGGWQLNITPGPSLHFGYWTGPGTYDFSYLEQTFTHEVWTHVAGVVDGDQKTLALYVNGRLAKRKAIPGTIRPGDPTLSMGTWSGEAERYLVGALDDVAIYSRALAGDEVAALAQHPVPDPL